MRFVSCLTRLIYAQMWHDSHSSNMYKYDVRKSCHICAYMSRVWHDSHTLYVPCHICTYMMYARSVTYVHIWVMSHTQKGLVVYTNDSYVYAVTGVCTSGWLINIQMSHAVYTNDSYMSWFAYIYISAYIFVCMYIYIYTCICVYVYTYTHLYTYKYIHTCKYDIYVCIYIYTYTHTHNKPLWAIDHLWTT